MSNYIYSQNYSKARRLYFWLYLTTYVIKLTNTVILCLLYIQFSASRKRLFLLCFNK